MLLPSSNIPFNLPPEMPRLIPATHDVNEPERTYPFSLYPQHVNVDQFTAGIAKYYAQLMDRLRKVWRTTDTLTGQRRQERVMSPVPLISQSSSANLSCRGLRRVQNLLSKLFRAGTAVRLANLRNGLTLRHGLTITEKTAHSKHGCSKE